MQLRLGLTAAARVTCQWHKLQRWSGVTATVTPQHTLLCPDGSSGTLRTAQAHRIQPVQQQPLAAAYMWWHHTEAWAYVGSLRCSFHTEVIKILFISV